MKTFLEKRLNLDWKIALLTISSTLLLMIAFYHSPLIPWTRLIPGWNGSGIFSTALDQTILFFIIPLLLILFVFRQKPARFGLGFGDWKTGVVLTFLSMALMTPILWLVIHGSSAMQAYYQPLTVGLPWSTCLDLFGWEFLFRGWLLFGYAEKFGPEAIWIQAIPFALAHMGKPEIETLSTIFGGFAFGWIAWRTKSFLYPFLIHWFVASVTIILAAGMHG